MCGFKNYTSFQIRLILLMHFLFINFFFQNCLFDFCLFFKLLIGLHKLNNVKKRKKKTNHKKPFNLYVMFCVNFIKKTLILKSNTTHLIIF